MISSYSKKVIVSGNVVEVYEYDKPILEGYSIKENYKCGRCFEASEEDKQINRGKVFNRAKRDLRRLINANIGEFSKFVTLTFRENVTDLKQANYEWKKFKQRLETKVGYKLQYVVVIEFQKRGAIHYHCVFFNLPYIQNKDLAAIWRNGFIKINKIDNVDNVGAYVCKYMTKTDDDRLLGQKMYFSSRGLEKPTEIKEKNRVETLASALPASALTYSNTFENEYNLISYKQYNLNSLRGQKQIPRNSR